MGGVALQAPAALWQLCGFHRDRLAPAGWLHQARDGCALLAPAALRRPWLHQAGLLRVAGQCYSPVTCGFTGCGQPARLAPAALSTLWLHRAGRLCSLGSCCLR